MPEDFKSQLRALGLNSGDVVLMHSSMKALKTEKAPVDFIKDVLSVIGPEGTLLVPALTYENVTADTPYFSVSETEPCIGLIPRTFFHMPGVVRSLHPTHSICAYGKLADELVSKHHLDETPVGPNSPIMRLLEHNGKILFIGDILHACTFMHGVEEIVGAPYTLTRERTRYFIKDANMKTAEKEMFAHDFYGWGAEYQYVKNILTYPEIKTGKVGQADSYLIEASALLKKAAEKFKGNPYYFVTDIRKYINLRNVTLYIAVSLDGYIATEEHNLDWLFAVKGEGDNGFSNFYNTIDTILMGRTTYEWIMKQENGNFPYKGKECYVFSRSGKENTEHVKFIKDNAVGFVKNLKRRSGKNIWIVGGGDLLSTFTQENLVDEIIITVAPVLLGKGIKLFKENDFQTKLSLKATTRYNQFIELHYSVVY